MGIFDFLKRPDINEGVAKYQQTEDAVLLDVRTALEYKQEGHVPESVNFDVENIEKVATVILNKSTPLFVYCYSGMRSRQAVKILKNMGYANVTDIGGIASYRGKVEM